MTTSNTVHQDMSDTSRVDRGFLVCGSGPSFAGKTICITGAMGGIGQAIVEAFANSGASVWAFDLAASSSDQVGSPTCGSIRHRALDVTSASQWKSCTEEVLQASGKVDVLIQCASIVHFATLDSTSYEQWKKVLGVNLDGVFLGIQTVLPMMKKQKQGVLLQIGSYLAKRPMPGLASYCVSKAAVETLTRVAALEAAAASPAIRVNAILPGGVKTAIWKSHPAWKHLVTVGKSEAAAFQALASSTPQKRFSEPDEIAQLSLYLASDAAAFVTGACWSIDGGITA